MDTPSQPLKFTPSLREKIWGGRRLGRMYRAPDPDRLYGEAWLIDDRVAAADGPLAGQQLRDIAGAAPADVLGSRNVTEELSAFPLLIKFLDAEDVLSVQVHPDDAYARRYEGQPFGKCEVWYVLEAEPGARIIHGFKAPLTKEDLRRVIAEGRLVEAMQEVEVRPGDVVMNTPGTVHALGKGMLIYELQQSSDLTYRLYDWDRQSEGAPRPLHIEPSIAVADLAPFTQHKTQPVVLAEAGVTRTVFAACRYFAAEMLSIPGAAHSPQATTGATFHVLTALSGQGTITCGAGAVTTLSAGESALVPANLGPYRVEARSDPFVVIKAYVPDLMDDIVRPLRAYGISGEQIAQLGGDARRSDLRSLV